MFKTHVDVIIVCDGEKSEREFLEAVPFDTDAFTMRKGRMSNPTTIYEMFDIEG